MIHTDQLKICEKKVFVGKGQKILEANYGDLNSSKKQTKSEKEFDLRTLRPFKKNRSYFGRNEGVVNWFRDFLTNTKLL